MCKEFLMHLSIFVFKYRAAAVSQMHYSCGILQSWTSRSFICSFTFLLSMMTKGCIIYCTGYSYRWLKSNSEKASELAVLGADHISEEWREHLADDV